jgi:hypothetical protein
MLVLPFVPVTPITFNVSLGLLYHSEIMNPALELKFSTGMHLSFIEDYQSHISK